MNLLLAVLILVLVPVSFGISNHDYIASSFILERFVSLTGIILLTPIFLPEQDKNIAELAESKYTSPTGIYLMRFLLATVSLIILV
jgi:putative effector of murein hydrolase